MSTLYICIYIYLFIIFCYPNTANTNFWKMNLIMAYPPWTYLLLYLCYGHLTCHFMDFHQPKNRGSYAFLCPSIWCTSPSFGGQFTSVFFGREVESTYCWRWKNGELNIPKLMIAFLSNKGSGLRRFWNQVYWKWYTTFLAISCGTFISPSKRCGLLNVLFLAIRTGPTNLWCRGLKAVCF